MYYIYYITNSAGKAVYVGVTKNPVKRKYQHIQSGLFKEGYSFNINCKTKFRVKALELECDLITELKPPKNKNKDRDKKRIGFFIYIERSVVDQLGGYEIVRRSAEAAISRTAKRILKNKL